jgi:RNA polymerase sigma-70 factor (ECF subfamily)
MSDAARAGEGDADLGASTDAGPLYLSLYVEHFQYVWRQLRRLGIGEADLPDVTHDVFVIVHRRLPSFDRARPVRPWLFGVLFRVAADHLRLSRRTREVLPANVLDPEDPGPRPDEALLDRQTRAVASQALAVLDERLRSVLLMHDLGDLDVGEIAAALQIPAKTVYTRLRVARTRFAAAAARLAGVVTAAR